MLQYLVFVRHEESVNNRALSGHTDEIFYSVSGADIEVPLTEEGRTRAPFIGRRLAAKFRGSSSFARAYSSEFLRVRETLSGVCLGLGYEPPRTIDNRLNKRSYGLFWNLTYRGVELLYPEEHRAYKRQGGLAYRPPGGENYFDLFARVDAFIEEISKSEPENILIVAHSVVLLAAMRRLEGLPDTEVLTMYERVALPNGHVLVFSRDASGGEAFRRDGDDSPAPN